MDIIIQARLSSKRLPSKVLLKINNKHILDYQLDRISHSNHENRIIIATSTKKEDDEIEFFCKKRKLICFRGDLNNVAKRIADLVKKYDIDSFVRLSADSPLIDPRIIDKAINLYLNNKFDLVTNKFPRSFPIGQTVEVINSNTFLKSFDLIKTKEYKEHVTLHLYKYFSLFKIKNFSNKTDYSKHTHAIDTQKNFLEFTKILNNNDFLLKKKSFKNFLKINEIK